MRKKVLIADDEEDILKLVAFRLDKAGYAVMTAANGREALDLAKKEKPDLILLDLRMPVMDGYELCRMLKSDERLKDIPVIFLTASSAVVVEQKTKEYRAEGYLIKPFKPEELLEKVKRFIE